MNIEPVSKPLSYIKTRLHHFAPKKMGITLLIPIVILVILAGLLVSAFRHPSTAPGGHPFDAANGLIRQGVLETKEVSINSKLAGRILHVLVEEGQEVKAGDVIVELSTDELLAKKAQAEAGVTQAEAALQAAKEQQTQAEAGVSAANALAEQAKAGVSAAEGKHKEAKAGVTASQKQQEAAQAIQEKAENGAREQEIAQAEVAYQVLKTSYDRVVQLEEKGAVSKQRLDEVKAQLDLAEQTLSMAKEGARAEDKKAATASSEMAQAGIEVSENRVLQAEAGVLAAQAQLTQATAGVQSANALLLQAQAGVSAKEGLVAQAKGVLAEVNAYLESASITAPMDGTITELSSEEGELVSTGTRIASLSDLDGAWITVNVPETELAQIHEGQSVSVYTPVYPEERFHGTVTTINAQPNFAVKRSTNENGSFDIVSFGVKVRLDSHTTALRPGMTAFVQFERDVLQPSIEPAN